MMKNLCDTFVFLITDMEGVANEEEENGSDSAGENNQRERGWIKG